MEPFYFGSAGKRLFGAYHPARVDRRPGAGVVMCYPVGQEYMRSHRAFLRLAILLSTAGFHVLRFDYSGCGDSGGAFEVAGIGQWLEDVGTAIDELKGGCAIDTLCLVGLRLGASLSALVGTERDDIDCMALWEPVVVGDAYIAELLAAHGTWLSGSFARPRPDPDDGADREVLGYRFTDRLMHEVRSIDLRSLRVGPARDILLVESAGIECRDESIDVLERLGCSVTCESFPGTEVWVKREDELDKSMVPVQVLEGLVAWLSGMVW